MLAWPLAIAAAIALIYLLYKFRKKTLLPALASFMFFAAALAALAWWGLKGGDWTHHTLGSGVEEGAGNVLGQTNDLAIIKIKEKVLIDAPVVKQLPELPRGCEVTSLAMLMETAGTRVDKMELARKIQKDETPYQIKNGMIHFGNPHSGYVGNMYTYSKPGYGVYHEPVQNLAEEYLPDKIVNLTGQSFDELKIPLSDGRPVWVIINTQYRELEDSYFETWQTKAGAVRVTMKEHSVLITGYDRNYVYFNDPLTGKKNRKAPIDDFEKSWVQMGSQALTYLN